LAQLKRLKRLKRLGQLKRRVKRLERLKRGLLYDLPNQLPLLHVVDSGCTTHMIVIV
jgi:hypothetical protein